MEEECKRFIHLFPRDKTKPLRPVVCGNSHAWKGYENQKKTRSRYKDLRLDYKGMDLGQGACRTHNGRGTVRRCGSVPSYKEIDHK